MDAQPCEERQPCASAADGRRSRFRVLRHLLRCVVEVMQGYAPREVGLVCGAESRDAALAAMAQVQNAGD